MSDESRRYCGVYNESSKEGPRFIADFNHEPCIAERKGRATLNLARTGLLGERQDIAAILGAEFAANRKCADCVCAMHAMNGRSSVVWWPGCLADPDPEESSAVLISLLQSCRSDLYPRT
jgi:hypothetical protein